MTGQSMFLRSNEKSPSEPSSVDKFLQSKGAKSDGHGRLIFALDATASRGQTWDMAKGLTGDMIREVAATGRLNLQLVYYRGGLDVPKQCSASDWTSDPAHLAQLMAKVECRAGYTQIAAVLAHARRETLKAKVGALALIGDACEPIEDGLDRLCGEARALGSLGTPVFAFQEGRNPDAEKAFRQIAELSHGAYGRFDAGAAKQLGELIKAAALFAVGGVAALTGREDRGSALLLEQLGKKQ
jgi:hypothetical protein